MHQVENEPFTLPPLNKCWDKVSQRTKLLITDEMSAVKNLMDKFIFPNSHACISYVCKGTVAWNVALAKSNPANEEKNQIFSFYLRYVRI